MTRARSMARWSFGAPPLLFALVVAIAPACGGAPSAKDASSSNVVAKKIDAPLGVTLVSACTPTGPELCFNAVDDNCNGVIDEGCGSGTGALQFTLAWGDSPADVDLLVSDPSGGGVSPKNRATASGLRLDHDCPEDGCSGQNIENVFFEGADPPKGAYLVEVKLADLKGAPAPLRVRLGARVGSRSYGADVDLSPNEPSRKFTFHVE